MDTEYVITKTAIGMLESLTWENLMVKELFFFMIQISMKEIGRTAHDMEKGRILIKVLGNMKVNGEIIKSMVQVLTS